MLRKLYAMVAGSACPDNPDSPQHHEVLLPGFLYGMIIKERLEESLDAVKSQVRLDIRQNKPVDFASSKLPP
jgi:DNA-directed RNA polymerase I subunit RPA2